jgi:hypothetical protein
VVLEPWTTAVADARRSIPGKAERHDGHGSRRTVVTELDVIPVHVEPRKSEATRHCTLERGVSRQLLEKLADAST